ncbi:Phd finger protein, partial [Thalictrum thalictroides]
ALWEDTKTGSKWAIVNSCYFPADLPEVVGRPCSPESNEVYESNHGSTVRAGLVQGTCEVLPPNKFKEESERRIHSDNGSQPLFLC